MKQTKCKGKTFIVEWTTKTKRQKAQTCIGQLFWEACCFLGCSAGSPKTSYTHKHTCHSKNTQCEVVINLIMSHVTNHWYLSTVEDLHHKFHTALDEEHQTITEKDCDEEDIDLMHVMYSVDNSPATIAKIV